MAILIFVLRCKIKFMNIYIYIYYITYIYNILTSKHRYLRSLHNITLENNKNVNVNSKYNLAQNKHILKKCDESCGP